jgi:deoxyribodipyrimidine photo-lyase
MRILFIFRRDFRSIDNIGLNSIGREDTIYPVFIFTPEQITSNKYKSDNSVQFMIESLLDLKKNINITFCYGDMLKVIEDIVIKNNIDSIRCNTDYTPYAIKREKKIETLAKKLKVEFTYYHDVLLFEPSTIRNQSGSIYQKFTPFYRYAIKQKVSNPTNKKIGGIKKVDTKYEITSSKMHSFYTKNDLISVHGGRSDALLILKGIKEFSKYESTRDKLHIDTTHLSAYLKFGCVSIRECFHAMKKSFNLSHPLIRQLIWREFYYHLGYGFIERFGNSLKTKYDNIVWENDMTLFKAWCSGKTGYPIVDSCMMQLNTTGWMHNRGRLIVASFLIKNLHIDWKLGEKYFAQKLVDYDVLVNQGNWQWVSGSGADSQPYFRVFNPWLQSDKFDKEALYIKKWLPQLME